MSILVTPAGMQQMWERGTESTGWDVSLTNWNYSLSSAFCLACHPYLFCFIQSYFKRTNPVLKLRIKMNYFYYLSDFALSLLYFWVVFQCWVYSLLNLFAQMLSSKHDCSENVTTQSCHLWVGSIELLMGVVWGFFSSQNVVRGFFVYCINVFHFR